MYVTVSVIYHMYVCTMSCMYKLQTCTPCTAHVYFTVLLLTSLSLL